MTELCDSEAVDRYFCQVRGDFTTATVFVADSIESVLPPAAVVYRKLGSDMPGGLQSVRMQRSHSVPRCPGMYSHTCFFRPEVDDLECISNLCVCLRPL